MSTSRTTRSSMSVAGEPGRVRTDGTRAEPDDHRPGGRVNGGTAYERYKQQLHAFFNGDKPLPDHLRAMLATRPGAADHGFSAEDTAAAPVEDGKKRRGKKDKKTDPEDGSRRRVVSVSGEDVALADAIRRASSPREAQAAVDALLARGYPLPMDAEILGKALGHSDDAVLEQALTALNTLIGEGGFRGNGTLLKTRLKNVALLSQSASVRELCTAVAARL